MIHGFDELQDFLAGLVVQSAGRLITQENIRIFHDGPADGGALLLTAGELIGQLVPVLPQTQGMQQLVHIQRLLAQVGSHLDVLPNRQVGNQIVHLEHIAQVVPPVGNQLFRVHFSQLGAADGDFPGIRRIDAADDVQQGAFAAAAGAQQHAEIPLVHLHIHALEYLNPAVVLPEALLDIPYLQKHAIASSPLSNASISYFAVSVN